VFKKIETTQITNFNDEFARHIKNINLELSKCVIMNKLQEICTPYTLKNLEQRISKAISYRYKELATNKWYFLKC